MKFTVEIDEFWLDEDSNGFEEELKESIKNDVCHQIKKLMLTSIETEITNVVKEQIEETLKEQIQVLVADVISTGEIRVDSYSDNKIPIKDWIKKKFNGNCGYGSAENQIKELAKKFGDEMKQRYDLLFASQIVAKLDEHGLLKEDIAKLLIDKKRSYE